MLLKIKKNPTKIIIIRDYVAYRYIATNYCLSKNKKLIFPQLQPDDEIMSESYALKVWGVDWNKLPLLKISSNLELEKKLKRRLKKDKIFN
uniref:Uncharacterized protein n=1 Tax=Mimivirus LCMiAC02 TaxID=2506609 RepID=A0A4D5XER1_9VIRU|nr:MAG: hypothetical protein LCMiAC02_03320 [Mimivirus LCMiAC02]